MGYEKLAAFVLVTGINSLVPGPNMMFVMTQSVWRGRSSGLAALAGLEAGNVVWFVMSAFGLGVLLKAAPMLFAGLTLAGALYLAWMGLQALRDAMRGHVGEARAAARPAVHAFRDGLAVAVGNPKGLVYITAILPPFVQPELATLVDSAPEGAGWLHEIKYDGYRIQARIDGQEVRLFTRKGLDWTRSFTPVAKALAALKIPSALLDGEIVVEDESGRSDFSALQAALKSGKGGPFVYRVFDLLYADGRDIRALPLNDRKTLLEKLLAAAPPGGPVRFSEHIEADGQAMVRHACRLGLEGVVSKRIDAPYRSGRTKSWVKTKCSNRQELVIAGFVPSSVAKGSIGSLVMGLHEDGKLVHVGRVGTGYTSALARDLYKTLHPLETGKPPFAAKLPRLAAKDVRWVKPQIVAEVEFRGFTGDGMVRQGAFKGLRDDKDAQDVVRERTIPAPSAGASGTAKAPRPYKLTHPDRIYWPDIGLTKQGLAEYYDAIANRILPHIAGRPLSLVRCPGGIDDQCFFQKHGWDGMPDAIRRVVKGGDEHIFIEDRDGLIALVQSGSLEIHVWGATIARLETPDRIVFDLDPADDVTWDAVVAGALEVRARLKKTGLASFVKTSGGKGLHVVAPLTPKKGWDEVKDFTHALAQAMAKDSPGLYVATMSKKARRGRIFIDYLRNGRAQTSVATFSARARPGAPVATPVAWSELGPDLTPARFTVENLGRRLSALKRDPWSGFFKLKQTFDARKI